VTCQDPQLAVIKACRAAARPLSRQRSGRTVLSRM
jgi:hypothetical protein